ncbi:hypothetical protein BKP44_05590 [Formosa algae]|nr:hypothetical protein BKP44_05590 [Formosa algae]
MKYQSITKVGLLVITLALFTACGSGSKQKKIKLANPNKQNISMQVETVNLNKEIDRKVNDQMLLI